MPSPCRITSEECSRLRQSAKIHFDFWLLKGGVRPSFIQTRAVKGTASLTTTFRPLPCTRQAGPLSGLRPVPAPLVREMRSCLCCFARPENENTDSSAAILSPVESPTNQSFNAQRDGTKIRQAREEQNSNSRPNGKKDIFAPPPVIRGSSEISLGWEPFVIEREDLDNELCARMNWNVTGKAAEQTLIALTKFKVMAARAQATVAQRHDHAPIVNSLQRTASASCVDAAAAAARYSSDRNARSHGLDAQTEEELRQIATREDKIDEGRRLLQQRLDFLKLRSLDMEVCSCRRTLSRATGRPGRPGRPGAG